MMSRASLLRALIAVSIVATPVSAEQSPQDSRQLSDEELSRVTGRFVLPNGVELALSVTSDTVVDGHLILRTVLTVDHTTQLQVFGRGSTGASGAYATGAAPVAPVASGVTIALDRKSGIQTITPTYAAARGGVVSVGGASQDPASLGLVPVAVTPGGPAIATADGVVSLQAVRNGSQVSFEGDRLGVVNLVGQSIATAVVNSANDRTLDSVTNVSIDARNIAPYQLGSAQMRVDALAIDATRRMMR